MTDFVKYGEPANAPTNETETGVVRHVPAGKSFFFVASDQGGRDVFCHKGNMADRDSEMPRVGDRVSYRLFVGADGRLKGIDTAIITAFN